jgi:excisionase family DNA binding protein
MEGGNRNMRGKTVKAQALDPNAIWLTAEEAGQYIRYSPDKILALIKSNVLPATKLPGTGSYRIRKTDVDEIMFNWTQDEILQPKSKKVGNDGN